jgi:hypothetical protein
VDLSPLAARLLSTSRLRRPARPALDNSKRSMARAAPPSHEQLPARREGDRQVAGPIPGAPTSHRADSATGWAAPRLGSLAGSHEKVLECPNVSRRRGNSARGALRGARDRIHRQECSDEALRQAVS